MWQMKATLHRYGPAPTAQISQRPRRAPLIPAFVNRSALFVINRSLAAVGR